MTKCFHCEKELKEDETVFMYAIDRPYVNLWFHPRCFAKIEDNLLDYFSSNYNKIEAFIRERDA